MIGIKNRLKYALLDKKTDTIELYYYKKDLAERIGVSVMTITRNENYENNDFKVFSIGNVVLSHAIGYKHNILRWKYKGEE